MDETTDLNDHLDSNHNHAQHSVNKMDHLQVQLFLARPLALEIQENSLPILD